MLIMVRPKRKIVLLAALGIILFLGIGIAIPKLTVHDLVSVDVNLRQCAAYAVSEQFDNFFERAALVPGKSRIMKTGINNVEIESFTLFRIPLGVLRGQPDMKLGVTCDFAGTPDTTIVSAAQVPDGWYSHDLTSTIAAPELLKYIVLTKHKDLPQRNPSDAPYDTPQITVSEWKISISPEQKVQQEGLGTSDSIDAGMDAGRWSTYKGHKMFTIMLQEGGDAVLLFGGNTMYEFTFVGESIDRIDLWKIINYYAEDSAFPMISREETQANCKTHNLPPGQEYDIQGDPETGYVTLGYTLTTPKGNAQETYLFLNYNDDLSQCSSDVAKILTNAKQSANKLTQ